MPPVNTPDFDTKPAAKQPPVLCARTQALIAKVSALLGGPVLAYWNNPRGSICGGDVIALMNHSLSPLDRDNNRVNVSLDELNRVIRLWRAENGDTTGNPYKSLFAYVHPLVIGAVDRAESLSIMLCRELLAYHIASEDRAHEIAATLNRLYSEMGQKATTDFDEIRAHGNEILNILEGPPVQVYVQDDKDWFYRSEERRWITMNDNSGWRMIERRGGRTRKSVMHIA